MSYNTSHINCHLVCVCMSSIFCPKFVVFSCFHILWDGPIELFSIVVIHLGDTDIGLCHPLIVQCIYVCAMYTHAHHVPHDENVFTGQQVK